MTFRFISLDSIPTKGSIVVECGKLLQKKGYRIKILNTINFGKSMHYNPFSYIHSEKDILKLVTTLIANTKGEGKAGDDFWVKAETLLYTALIGYLHYEAAEEERNFSTLIEMINAMETREDDEDFQNSVDIMFEKLEKRDPNHFAVRQYKKYKLAAGKTAKSILISCAARLAPFDIAELRELTAYDELELDTLGDQKSALFIIISDTDDTFNFLVSLCYGSRTAGTDGRTIKDLESLSDEKLIALVQRKLNWYIPQSVRRVEIPKGNDPSKKRPLGIPTILDRLIQQCVLQVLEPICEAKFHDHSFGFRPNRSQEHAIALVYKNIQLSHYCYVVDIDIKGFFDGLVLPGADILRDAGFDVAGQQHLGKAVQRRARRRTLRQNIGTISVLFNHAANPANLPLDAAEPVEQIALLFVIPMLCSAMTAAGHHLFTHACSPRLREHYIPRGGILSRKIPK